MSNATDDPKDSVADLGITINEILRYAYSGLLPVALFVAMHEKPVETITGQPPTDATGPAILFFVFALAAGSVVYALHRMVWGHWFLGFVHDTIHRGIFERFWAWSWKPKAKDLTSKQHYLEVNYRIPRHASLNAYHMVRDACLGDKPREILHRQHSEAYALYITAFWAIVADILMWTCLPNDNGLRYARAICHGWLCGLALVTLVAAVLYDILISKAECLYLKTFPGSEKAKEFCAILKPLGVNSEGKEERWARFFRHISVPVCWAVCLPVLSAFVEWTADWKYFSTEGVRTDAANRFFIGLFVPLFANICSGKEEGNDPCSDTTPLPPPALATTSSSTTKEPKLET